MLQRQTMLGTFVNGKIGICHKSEQLSGKLRTTMGCAENLLILWEPSQVTICLMG